MPESEVALLPITLQLPMETSLQTLRLRNAMLPWSSNIFTGLRELFLDFGDCNAPVEMSEDELFRTLDASSQLERLSLVQVGPRTPVWNNGRQITHERTVQLPSLSFLRLENESPEVVGYILTHIGTPAITSLVMRSRIPSQDIARSLNLMVPDGRFQGRLLSDPPVFKIQTADEEPQDIMYVDIGNFTVRFDFDLDDAEIISNAIMTHLRPLVPPSVTALTINYPGLGLGELDWKEFVISHPEVRSIECSNSSDESMSGSLWDALSPTGIDAISPCPKLEVISLFEDPATTRLLNCLLNRKNAGFELKYLKATNVVDGLAGEFRRLVKTLEVEPLDFRTPEDELAQEVRLVQSINFARNDRFLVGPLLGARYA